MGDKKKDSERTSGKEGWKSKIQNELQNNISEMNIYDKI